MNKNYNFIRQLIREQIEQSFDTQEIVKSQSAFNWHVYYPDDIKSSIETSGNNIILYHYGTDNNTGYLSPESFGSNSYTPDAKQWGVNRIFFYIHKEDKEWRVNGKEYIVNFPMNKLYPFRADPYDFYGDILKEKNVSSISVNDQVRLIGEKIISAGFSGIIFNWGSTFRVDIFEKVKI